MFNARHVGHDRRAARRDQDIFCRNGLIADLDGVLIKKHRPAIVQRYVVVFQDVVINPVQPVDLFILIGDQLRPGVGCLAHRPAISFRVVEVFGKMARIDQQLFGHTAANDAGAADTILLGDGHAGAEAGGNARGANAAGPGADNKQIVIKCHFYTSLGSDAGQASGWRSPWRTSLAVDAADTHVFNLEVIINAIF